MQDLEDEALLEEVEQGIIMLDRNLTIVKVSKWIEKNFKTISRVLLGKRIQELEFYDTVSNRGLLPDDYFYKNLENEAPQKLNWRLLYKNQYGKYEKFLIKQIPLKVQARVIGFLLSVRFPPKSLQEMIGSYNQLACFRLSSQVAKLKNLCITSDEVKKSPQYYFIQKSLSQITQLLNDNSIKTDLTEGNREITLTTFDLQIMLKNVIDSLRSSGNISLWTISPLLKNKPIILKSDANLSEMLITYALKATLYFAKGTDVNINSDEDEISKRVSLIITADCSSFPDIEHVELLEPFFQGKLIILSKYEGSGLEISNANLIAKFLNFDFNAQINNAKLAIKITFNHYS